MKARTPLLWLGVLTVGACHFDITNPNTPSPIQVNPSRTEVAAAVAGILISAREDQPNWILKAGIFGREALRLDPADPRFVTELLQGPLDPGSRAFVGGQWQFEYRTIRSAYDLLNVIGTATTLSAEEQNAARGFAQTMQAWSFIIVLNAHTDDSIPIDVNRPLSAPPAPFVKNAEAWAHVVTLLDSAKTALQSGGSAFPFALPSGFAGFDQPSTFLKFNRALMARVQVHRASPVAPGLNCTACWDSALTALSESFVDTSAGTRAALDKGVYFNFSTGPGDITNSLFQDPPSAINLVHPFIQDSAETQSNGTDLDARYLAKVTPRGSALTTGLHTSGLSWIRYTSPSAPVPIIRNEELILLRAEANLGKGNRLGAAADINFIRVHSGGLSAIGGLAAQTPDQILGQLLKQKLYSLLYEGGYRWIDMRRYGRLGQILVTTGDQVFPTLPIPTNEVLARQP